MSEALFIGKNQSVEYEAGLIELIENKYDFPGIISSATERYGTLPEGGIFISIFYGQLRPGLTAGEWLALKNSDVEAVGELSLKPGFIDYQPGEPDENGYTHSMCAWLSAEAASEATRSSDAHQRATMMARMWYVPESIKVERYLAKLDPENPEIVILTPIIPEIAVKS